MKILFFGTPEYASAALEAILEAGYEVCGVVTRADKPQGRGYKVLPTPVKVLAESRGIPVFQPDTLREDEVQQKLRSFGADLFITAAYGRIFPPEVLAIPPLGCVNIHASLLPHLRGASPINRALLAGDTRGGVTVMYMDVGLDTGDIILQKKIPIPTDMDFGTYYAELSALGAEAILQFLEMAQNGVIPRTKQDEALASYAKKVEKSEMQLDLSVSASEVANKIRGLSPSPCAYTFLAGKRVKIFAAHSVPGKGTPGEILSADRNGITLACGNGAVCITDLQPEGKKRMTAEAFLAGNKL